MLAFKVCELTGVQHPDFLELDTGQLLDWQRYIEQHGCHDDIHWGLLISTICNQWRDNSSMPVRPSDVMPYLKKAPIDTATLKERLGSALHKA